MSYRFPESFTEKIEQALVNLGYSLDKPRPLASAIKDLSDLYQSSNNHSHIWSQPRLSAAYLSYFFPFNYLRLKSILVETQQVNFPLIGPIIDFGAGPGTVELAFKEQNLEFINIEKNQKAWALLTTLGISPNSYHMDLFGFDINSAKTAVFSYSLNELIRLPQWAEQMDQLILLEPSTHNKGRELMSLRKKLLTQGFNAWAPCMHQNSCPLLEEYKKNWCHQRIFIEMPDWYQQLEQHLPMKNRSLTYSYLLLSKVQPPKPKAGQVRVIGDTLKEKGKTRQQICRGPNREFLSWLHRHGEPEQIPRGSVIDLPEHEVKGHELRVKQGTQHHQ